MGREEDFHAKLNRKQKENLKKFLTPIKWLAIIIIPIIVIGLLSLSWITEYIWMGSLGFEQVFTTVLFSRAALGVVGFVLYFVVTYITLYWIHKSYIRFLNHSMIPNILLNKKSAYAIVFGISIVFGLIGTSMVQGIGWEPTLKALNYESFGQTDPYFNLDISFYIFLLPFLELIVNLLLGLTIFMTIIVALAYSVFNMYRESRLAQVHLGISISLIGVFLAANHLLDPYNTLLTNQVNVFQTSVVHGLSYTDDVINIPKAYILAGVAIIGVIILIFALIKGNLIWMAIPIALYITVALAGQLVSAAVQNYVVSPNEFHREQPYLQHNLDYTLEAYDLNDMTTEQHPANDSLDEEMIERNQLTIDNVRINDSRPILDVYNQLQTFRNYYQFNDVDIDRYYIDDEYQQVFIGARELNTSDLPDQSRTWVNEKLRYTHGYGVTMSHVNEITQQGQPEYILQDLPPEGDIEITRPQIYFGEEQSQNVIVNTEVDEFDYPAVGDENMSYRFSADSGVSLSGINRLLFAIDEGSFRMLVSDQLSEDSQLLATRNIMDRVQRIAPFLAYDQDPYIFVREDGSLAWMIDAYLREGNYPYSETYNGEHNYIRNSVKVMVDAYTGEVDFFVVEEDDPVLQTYENIFPDLFTSDIPEDVEAHFRYPVDLFTIQADMYGTYHMSNLEVFYNREDSWEFATERYFEHDITMEPYYITMQLPGNDFEEFVLMTPYTPRNRQNMIAWIGARNDGENYGDLVVYEFPKQRNVYGPQQIENRINQDSRISQELNLWSQGGSSVIRGNLLTIPIEDTIMYVEPIYIESSNATSLPEVKQVIVAYGDHIVMEATFEESLERILDLIEAGVPGNMPDVDDDIGDIDEDADMDEDTDFEEDTETELPGIPGDAEDTLNELSTLFNDYQNALSRGDWEGAGQIMNEIEELLGTIE
ncbi:uncharacterized membrane protein (UPF0182 family) [Alkalibacillus filiformis]|uniref:UPF0182 protein J2R98_001076 n=1 Tax=Alkalibacillus filiformis TaxID=200990 RepID=A0ABU0DS41_9BACI|nr:UPF0182 family protein [Alkalibacillus filiformis]MDQ0351273.1 uncharacterized membrane protein (UPF0182 family) [Alkalibacillus filiformis]